MFIKSLSKRHQAGASSLAILIVLMMSAVILLCGFKLSPVYFDQWAVMNITEGFEAESDLRDASEDELIRRFTSRMQANGIRELSVGDILYMEKGETSVYFEIDYERRINIYKNIDAVVKFNETREYSY